MHVRERAAELGDAAAERVAVLGAHLRRSLANEVVRELPDRALLAVHVDRHARAGLGEPADRRERGERVRRVVEHLVGRHVVERLRRERKPLHVPLDDVHVVAAARLPVRRARRLSAQVDGDDLRAAVGEHARVDAAAATRVEDELPSHRLRERLLVAVAEALEVPRAPRRPRRLLVAVRVADDRPLERERRVVRSVGGEERQSVLDRELATARVDEAPARDLVAGQPLVDEAKLGSVVRGAQQLEERAFHGRLGYVSRARSPRSRRSGGRTSGHARELLKPIRTGPSSGDASTRGIPNRPPRLPTPTRPTAAS